MDLQATNEKTLNKSKNAKEKSLEDSLELFGEDKDEFDIKEQLEYHFPLSKNTTDNILKTSRMVKIATLTLQGYEEIPNNGSEKVTYRLKKHPLASSEVIKGFQAILKPHADESNLASKMNWEEYSIKVMSDWGAFYKLCLKDKASPEKSKRTVYRVFQNCITIIGGIICDNPKNMDHLFNGVNQISKDNDLAGDYK